MSLNWVAHDVEKAWRVVSDFGGIADWMPTVSHCTVEGEGIGAVRTVTQAGTDFKKVLQILDTEKRTISYRIIDPTPFPMKGGNGTIHVEQHGERESLITWTCDAELIDEAGLLMVRPVMEGFIRSCIVGLKAALDENESVHHK